MMILERRSLEVWKGMVEIDECYSCGKPGLLSRPIKNYDHDYGWHVYGHDQPQWLWITCEYCDYQNNLEKLGVFRERMYNNVSNTRRTL